MGWLCCFRGRSSETRANSLYPAASTEYASCQDAFSELDGVDMDGLRIASPCTYMRTHLSGGDEDSNVSHGFMEQMGCLTMIKQQLNPPKEDRNNVATAATAAEAEAEVLTSALPEWRPRAGCTLSKRGEDESVLNATACFEDGDGGHYRVRSMNYSRTRVKEPNASTLYQLLSVDIFRSEKKITHVATQLTLDHLPANHHKSPAGTTHYPPLLIINLMLPDYSPSLFGSNDGPGWNVVQCYTLPPDFDADTYNNQKALGLFQRLVQNGKEGDGSSTRERLKVLARVVNVDEWAVSGPLSSAEQRLLQAYNEKPLITRPQHAFFQGCNYFEIDLDVHCYAFIARTALSSFMSRLDSVVWETAFIIQGNNPDELPEQLLACARMYRTNFSATRPFSDYVPQANGHASGPANGLTNSYTNGHTSGHQDSDVIRGEDKEPSLSGGKTEGKTEEKAEEKAGGKAEEEAEGEKEEETAKDTSAASAAPLI